MKLLGTSLLLLTVTACGASTGTPGSSAPVSPGSATVTTPGTSVTSAPATPAGPPPSATTGRPTQGIVAGDDVVAEAQVDARALPEGYPRSLTRSTDGRTLTLRAEEGGCRTVSARVTDQTPDQVVVLVAMTSPPKGRMCPDYIREVGIPLPLAAPLGSRTLVLRQG